MTTTPHPTAPKSALTDEQLREVYFDAPIGSARLRDIADAAVAAHVAQQDGAQPVAFIRENRCIEWNPLVVFDYPAGAIVKIKVPLYTHLAPRNEARDTSIVEAALKAAAKIPRKLAFLDMADKIMHLNAKTILDSVKDGK